MGAGWRLSCILQCAQWSFEGQGLCRTTTTDTTPSGDLNHPMTKLRSFLLTNAEPSHGGGELRLNRRDDSSDAYVAVVDAQRSTGAGSPSAPSRLNTPPPAVLNQLRAIPFRLAVLCGRPRCVEDGAATLAAAATLEDCCHDCFASDDGAWQGMLSWLEKVPDHFHTMVLHHVPAALLVLAYRVAVLVNRVEKHVYWFLGGGAKRLLMLIGDPLPPEASKVKSLVLNLTE
ncbi:hypothetical protein BKA61DRAFT_582328 [Leptodontidium sp. MPI-SDFR-AT-0119]|nr:hypothetical protein BKA61DRAFT_582328 [Leptodontidium sp. MPI-SDFR-AT-0119]